MIPSTSAVVACTSPKLLKIDIEGSEYELIQHLYSAGTLPLANRVYVELHDHKLSKDISKDYQLLDTLLSHDIEVMSWDAAGNSRNNNSKHWPSIWLSFEKMSACHL